MRTQPPSYPSLHAALFAVWFAVWFAVLLLSMLPLAARSETRQLIGWIEEISLTRYALRMQAKVDTGADTSSVHAEAIRTFEHDGFLWVDFTLRGDNGGRRELRRAITRYADIKRKSGDVQRRPVVMLEICIGGRRSTTEFTLSQRGHFNYPVLLGRSFLGDRYLVDPASQHLLDPECGGTRDRNPSSDPSGDESRFSPTPENNVKKLD